MQDASHFALFESVFHISIFTFGYIEIRTNIHRLVADSGNPWLIGVCCIDMDAKVSNDQIDTIFQTVKELHNEIKQ